PASWVSISSPAARFHFWAQGRANWPTHTLIWNRSGELRTLSFVNGFALPPRLRRDFALPESCLIKTGGDGGSALVRRSRSLGIARSFLDSHGSAYVGPLPN